MPRHKGGRHPWENLVSGLPGLQPPQGRPDAEESRMHLPSTPVQPKVSTYYLLHQYLHSYGEWRKFIPEWELDLVASEVGAVRVA